MHALPPAPLPAPRRQVFIGSALGSAAMVALFGGLLALFLRFRQATLAVPESEWKPAASKVPEVATNMMLIAFGAIFVMVQWSVWAARRQQRSNTALALGVSALLAAAVINAQAFVYFQMRLPIRDTTYATMFYGVTGTFLAFLVLGFFLTLVVAFRQLGGRADRDVIAAHALYWYCLGAVYAALWFVIYVTK